MAVSRFHRSAVTVIGLGVAIPALLLAGLGIYLTLRIAHAVQRESTRYHSYIAQQVTEAFEQELMDRLMQGNADAENAARAGASVPEILALLQQDRGEFGDAHIVPVLDLNGYSLITVESQPLVFAPGTGARRNQYFAGVLLRNADGPYLGAGGWWIDPRRFLVGHLPNVMNERLPANPRLYGGFEAIRRVSVEVEAPNDLPIAHVRPAADEATARIAPLTGPFEGYEVRVAATPDAPPVWTRRFVAIEITFIALMGLVLVTATLFGLRYTVRQLELAQLKASFVSNVTHELKTPIALIRLAVETIEMRRVTSPEETERFLRTIGRETLRLSQLVDNILDFARLEAGQRIFRFEEVDLGQVIRDTVDSLRPRFEHQGFKVDVDLPENLPTLRGDATALTHCLLNLLDNAIKYSRTRREVKVSAASSGNSVTVSVSDRGIGIPPGDQKRIFEKFVRLETGLVHDVKGAGLGLSLVDQIVRAHGGRVELVSVAGEGTTFTIVLPVTGAATQRTEPRRMTAS